MADVDPAIQAAQEAFDTAYGEAFDRAMGERGTSVLLTPIEAIVAAIRPVVERECYTRAAEAIEAAPDASPDDAPVHYDQRASFAWCVGMDRTRDIAAILVRGLAGLHGQEHR